MVATSLWVNSLVILGILSNSGLHCYMLFVAICVTMLSCDVASEGGGEERRRGSGDIGGGCCSMKNMLLAIICLLS